MTTQTTKRIVVISDLQIPYHHPAAVGALIGFVKRIKPDALACVGDEADLPMVSRWEDGYRGEYSPHIQSDLDSTRSVLAAFRSALGPDKPFHLVRSNHTDRLERYIERKAPAVAALRGFKYQDLVGLKELKITWHEKMAEIVPGVLLAHGDEGSISQVAGMTGAKLMEATGKSIVCGHTHRQGLVWASKGFNGRLESRFALEVGHLMDMSQAAYLRPRGAANWQLGFGILEVTGKHVTPYAVPMRPDGSFTWAGKIFS
jgi:UDP-2,3-diacylglucosamine pyrophosphatase LpxH